MKRIGGAAEWECELDIRFAEDVTFLRKRQTLRRGERVEKGDTLRLVTPGGCLIRHAMVSEVERVLIRVDVGCDIFHPKARAIFARVGAEVLDEGGKYDLARADGFADGIDAMIDFFEEHDQFEHGIFDGQIIKW